MTKKIILATTLCGLLGTLQADSLKEAFENSKVSGEFKAFYINRSYDFNYKDDVDRDALAIGTTLNFKTGTVNGFDFGMTFYNASKLDGRSDVAGENDNTLLGPNGDNYTVLGQAYLGYKIGNTSVKLGRQAINNPFAAPNNFRLLPNTFEGITLENKDVKDLTLGLAHISKVQTNGFANSVPTGGNLDTTSSMTRLGLLYGFGIGYKVGEFESLDKVILGQNSTESTNGMTYVSASYNGFAGAKISAWDYYIHDIMNIFTARASYKTAISGVKTSLAGFVTKQSDVGDNLLGKAFGDKEIDSTQVGFTTKGTLSNGFGVNFAYTKTLESEGSVLDGGIINTFGGANTYIISQGALHSNFGDTDAYMVGLNYHFKPLTGIDLLAMTKYFQYDIGEANGYMSGHAWTTKEIDFDFIYNYSKAVTLRFRANYPREWLELSDGKKLGFDEYRLIAYYRF